MPELIHPNSSKIVRLHEQPHFPAEDLSDDNKDMLLYTLDHDGGHEAMAGHLEYHQRYLYLVACRGLSQLGYKSKYDETGLRAFCRGYAGFETISDLVHEPKIYDNSLAIGQVARFLVDTSPRPDEPTDAMDAEIKHFFDGLPPEQDVEADENLLEPDYPSTEIPKDILRFIADAKRQQLQVTERHKPQASQMFAARQATIPTRFPNTAEVLMTIGLRRGEDVGQIQARLAGAQFARTLQTIE